MTHPTPSTDYCLNCHYNLSAPRPRHCGHCGQETDLHPPSMHEFIHEWVGHYVALEGPLWRSLWALVFLPGRLTVEYFSGRRRRYVLPLRVYLSLSFLCFIALHYLPTHVEPPAPVAQMEENKKTKRADNAASAVELVSDEVELKRCLAPDAQCSAIERQLAKAASRMEKLSSADWKARMWAWSPYALLLMQPLFATLLLLTFAGTGRRYAEHFVFSLHMHAFWFLALLFSALVGWHAPVALAVFLHGLKAMDVVYHRGRWGSVWRGLLLSLVYLLLLGVGVLVLSVMAAVAG